MQQISDSDVIENMWVIVIYKEEKFLGRVLEKRNSEYLVKCLQKPLGIREPQEMEKDAIFYEKIYHTDFLPSLSHNSTKQNELWIY